MSTDELVNSYVRALESADSGSLIAVLASDPRFVSPFSVWSTRRAVEAACTARARAFERVAAEQVLLGEDGAMVRWHGHIEDREIEGVDILGFVADGVDAIDVFLRPADALDAVYAAMTRAWPR